MPPPKARLFSSPCWSSWSLITQVGGQQNNAELQRSCVVACAVKSRTPWKSYHIVDDGDVLVADEWLWCIIILHGLQGSVMRHASLSYHITSYSTVIQFRHSSSYIVWPPHHREHRTLVALCVICPLTFIVIRREHHFSNVESTRSRLISQQNNFR